METAFRVDYRCFRIPGKVRDGNEVKNAVPFEHRLPLYRIVGDKICSLFQARNTHDDFYFRCPRGFDNMYLAGRYTDS